MVIVTKKRFKAERLYLLSINGRYIKNADSGGRGCGSGIIRKIQHYYYPL